MIGALDKSIAGYLFGWEEQRNGCRKARPFRFGSGNGGLQETR
jgi:hypothetical protein